MRGIGGYSHWIEGNDNRFQCHPIDGRPLRFEFFDIATETIQIDRKFSGNKELGQKRVPAAYNEVLLRQLFRKRKSPLATHHLEQTAVKNIVGVVHGHLALPLREQKFVVGFWRVFPRQHPSTVS